MPISFEEKSQSNSEVKKAIARYIWEHFITTDDNPRIIIDAGSSAEAVAAVITDQLAGRSGKEKDGLVVPTVFTHNLGAWQVLSNISEKIDLYLVGGRYNRDLNAIIEARVFESQLKLWSPNIAVIAVSGIDEDGLYCSNIQDEHPVKEQLAKKKVERRLIVCDHSKIGRTDVRMFVSLEELKSDCAEVFLITDEYDFKDITPAYRQPEYSATLDALEETLGKEKVIRVPGPRVAVPSGGHTGSARSPGTPIDFDGAATELK